MEKTGYAHFTKRVRGHCKMLIWDTRGNRKVYEVDYDKMCGPFEIERRFVEEFAPEMYSVPFDVVQTGKYDAHIAQR